MVGGVAAQSGLTGHDSAYRAGPAATGIVTPTVSAV